MSKVTKEYTINNQIVRKVKSFSGIDVYEGNDKESDNLTLYFCKGDDLLKILKVTADCGQNIGFVDGYKFI